MDFLFDEAATVEAAVYLLKKKSDQRMSRVVLLKLLYLSDRKSLIQWGSPITGARPTCMPMGPVLSQVYDLIKGKSESPYCYKTNGNWAEYLRNINKEDITFIKDAPNSELSEASCEILDKVYGEFGNWSWKKLSAYTHSLPEYKLPHGKKLASLSYEDVLKSAGKDDATIAKLSDEAQHFIGMRKYFHVS